MLRCEVRPVATFIAGTAIACVALMSCGTVDPGPDVGPPAGCNAPPALFVTDIWPRYFQQYQCGQSDCHDAATGHGFFRLQPVAGVTPPDPNSPVSTWPDAWQANFRAVQQNLSCSSPISSGVLAIPSGRGTPHPPGDVVTDKVGADALFNMWLSGS
jgi:hypothetical protein